MNSGKTLFAQLMAHLPWTTFSRIVTKYRGNHRVRVFPCTEHYRVMAFAQLTTGRASRTSKPVYRPSLTAFITLASAKPFADPLWPMPTRIAIGASMPNSPSGSSFRLGNFTPPRASDSTSAIRSTHWIQQPLICACRSSLWHIFGPPNQPSKCTPCWISGGISPASFVYRTASSTAFTLWIS